MKPLSKFTKCCGVTPIPASQEIRIAEFPATFAELYTVMAARLSTLKTIAIITGVTAPIRKFEKHLFIDR